MVKETVAKKRGRADSVLEARVDGMQDLKKLKGAQSRNWLKMKALINKDTTKLCLIQVPKKVRKHKKMGGMTVFLFLLVQAGQRAG